MIDAILDLLPKGIAFSIITAKAQYKLWLALSREFQRCKDFIFSMLKEIQPITSQRNQNEWLALYNANSIQLAQTYHTGIGGQTREYIERQLQNIDSTITVTVNDTSALADQYGNVESYYQEDGDPNTGARYGGVSFDIIITHPFSADTENASSLVKAALYYIPAHLINATIFQPSI